MMIGWVEDEEGRGRREGDLHNFLLDI